MRKLIKEGQPGSRRSLLVRLVLELVIVFFGVYFAFLFNQYTTHQEQKKHQVQLLRALNQEIGYFLQGASWRAPEMKNNHTQWQTALKTGERRVPLYFVMEGNALPTKSMWQVVSSFDALNLLDVGTIFELSKYYNSFDIMLAKYQKLIDFAEEAVIPIENKPQAFYQASGRLHPKYAAYMKRYADFLGLFDLMIKDSRGLQEIIENEIDRLER